MVPAERAATNRQLGFGMEVYVNQFYVRLGVQRRNVSSFRTPNLKMQGQQLYWKRPLLSGTIPKAELLS